MRVFALPGGGRQTRERDDGSGSDGDPSTFLHGNPLPGYKTADGTLTECLASAYHPAIIRCNAILDIETALPSGLPVLDVALPIVTFYAVVPWLVALLQFDLLLQFSPLADKLRLVGNAIDTLNDPADRAGALAQLFPFLASEAV